MSWYKGTEKRANDKINLFVFLEKTKTKRTCGATKTKTKRLKRLLKLKTTGTTRDNIKTTDGTDGHGYFYKNINSDINSDRGQVRVTI